MFFSVHRGDSRTVLAIPSLGIALKFPRVRTERIRRQVKELWQCRAHRARWSRTLANYLQDDSQSNWSLRRHLLKGIVDNWSEWRFSQAWNHPILAPTHAFLGLLNVQAYAPPLGGTRPTHGKAMAAILGQDILRDPHCFANHENFGVLNGHLVIVDYASLEAQDILRTYADKLVDRYVI